MGLTVPRYQDTFKTPKFTFQYHSPRENVERVELGWEVPLAGPVPDGHGGHDVTHDEVIDALRLRGRRERLDGVGVGRVHVLFKSSGNSTLNMHVN